MSLRKALVVGVNPSDHSVDLVMLDDGMRVVGAQVLTPNGSGRTGTVDLPPVPKRKSKWDVTEFSDQDQLAMVGFVGRNPVVVGFMYPQINQMTFDDPGRRLDRHQSDVYSTIDGDGNAEWHHPSGTFVRVGTSPASEDLGAKNFDKSFSAAKNASKAVHLQVTVANGGGTMFSLNVTPGGAVTLTAAGPMNIQTDSTATVHAAGALLIKSDESIKLEAPRIDLN